MLTHALSCHSKTSHNAKYAVPDPDLVEQVLLRGADPNFSYSGVTPWKTALTAAVSHFILRDHVFESNYDCVDADLVQVAEAWAQVFDLFIQHGADPNVLSERHQKLPGHPRLSPLLVVDQYFPIFISLRASKLKDMLTERGAKIVTRQVTKGVIAADTNNRETNSPSTLRWMLSWFVFSKK
jgi:hypothetical protein